MIGPSQTPLSGNTQRTQETDIHPPPLRQGGIRTRNPNKQAAARPTP